MRTLCPPYPETEGEDRSVDLKQHWKVLHTDADQGVGDDCLSEPLRHDTLG